MLKDGPTWMFGSSNDIVPAQTLLGTLHTGRAKQWWRGQTVGGDVGHVSKRGEREVWKVERLDEGDLGGGELAVRAELAQRGLEHPLAERTCRIAHGLGEHRSCGL